MIPCKSLLQAMAMSLFIASCAQEPQTTSVPVSHAPGATSANRALATELYHEVNAYRTQKGARVLQRHGGLDRLAEGARNLAWALEVTVSDPRGREQVIESSGFLHRVPGRVDQFR